MSDTESRGHALSRPLSRRAVLKSGALAGSAAFLAATGAQRALAQSPSPAPTPTPVPTGDGSMAGVNLLTFSGGYSIPAEMKGLEAWAGATGGNNFFNNVPFDEKPVVLAGIIATQDSQWDVMYTYDKFMQQFGRALLIPLSEGYTQDLADFAPAALKSFTTQNDQVLRGLPIHFGGYVWTWNKEVFEQIGEDPENPPDTWDALIELTPKFLEAGLKACVQPWLGTGGTFGDFYFKQMYNSLGKPFLSEDRLAVEFGGAEGLRTFETIERGFKSGFWDPDSLNMTNEHDAFALWNQGGVGSLIIGSDETLNITLPETGLRIQPGLDSGSSGSVEGSDGLGVSNYGLQKDASWSFYNTMFSPEVARTIVLDTVEHYPPARLSLMNDPEVQALNPFIGVWAEQAQHQVNLWSAPYNYSPVFDDVITRLSRGEIGAQEALDAAVAGVQQLIEDYLLA
jgi:ABC-type glycerol-3-phosphate transport system substrate-binding protein